MFTICLQVNHAFGIHAPLESRILDLKNNCWTLTSVPKLPKQKQGFGTLNSCGERLWLLSGENLQILKVCPLSKWFAKTSEVTTCKFFWFRWSVQKPSVRIVFSNCGHRPWITTELIVVGISQICFVVITIHLWVQKLSSPKSPTYGFTLMTQPPWQRHIDAPLKTYSSPLKIGKVVFKWFTSFQKMNLCPRGHLI